MCHYINITFHPIWNPCLKSQQEASEESKKIMLGEETLEHLKVDIPRAATEPRAAI